MRGYEDEYDDYLDEYEDEDQEEEEAGEEEYEAEEPSQELLEYMELRQRLKEDIRKQRKKELGGGSREIRRNASSRDNFGSFFGPSQPVISHRVIQESKSLLENPNLAAKVMKSSHSSNKSVASKPAGSKAPTSNHTPKVTNGVKRKIDMVKNTRDYSFLLSDDAELPGPSRGSLTQKVSAPYCDARLVQRSSGKQTSSDGGRKLLDDREVKRGSQMQHKAVIQKSVSINKPTQPMLDSRKRFGSSNGSGPGRSLGPKGVPGKVTGDLNDKKYSTPGAKNTVPASYRPTPSRQPTASKQSSLQNRTPLESGKSKVMSKEGVPISKPPMVIQKQQASLPRPQIKPPPTRNVAHPLDNRRPTMQQRDDRRPAPQQRDDRRPPAPQQRDDRRPAPQQRDDRRPSLQQRDDRRLSLHQRDDRRPALQRKEERRPALPQKDDRRLLNRKDDRRPARKPMRHDEDDDGEAAISMIRNMFRYDPNKYRDDDDISDMEANFDDILMEEKRSARIARQEDEEELRKIEEEERRERLRKQAKKRKLSHQ